MVELHPYQDRAIRDIFEAWNPRRRNLTKVLLQMPTGTGKTEVFAEIVRMAKRKNKKVLVVVHRRELVEQIRDRLEKFGVSAGLILAGHPREPQKDIQVASIQTLSRRKPPPPADIVIIDECHHSPAPTYRKLWEMYPNARFLGVTATPVRANGEGFADQYETLISGGSLSFFIREGYLSAVKQLVCSTPDLSRVRQRMNDYDPEMLGDVMLEDSLMADLVENYKGHIDGKKTIVFAVNVEHCREITERYEQAGIPSACVSAETPAEERREVLRQFREGEILVLVNVNIVSEGFDVPDCEAVQLARPTKSLALYLQQVGRCMRLAEGKEFGYVLDHASLWLEHGLCYTDREWNLAGKKVRRKTPQEVEAFGWDEDGVLREIRKPVEAKGLELVEVNEEISRLCFFEEYLRNAIRRGYKLTSVGYRYRDHLLSKSVGMTDSEYEYCVRRLRNSGYGKARGFLYYLRKEIHDGINERNAE